MLKEAQKDSVDLDTIHLYCSQIIKNASKYDEVFNRSQIDHLTGLPNKAYLVDRLEEGIVFCGRKGMPLCVLFFDLDGFKQVNDTYGHLVGDEVLYKAARALKTSFRRTDVIGRYGGDEFVAIMFDTSINEGIKVMNRAVKAVEQIWKPKPLITVSAGLSTYPVDGVTVEELLGKADFKMYEQKKRSAR